MSKKDEDEWVQAKLTSNEGIRFGTGHEFCPQASFRFSSTITDEAYSIWPVIPSKSSTGSGVYEVASVKITYTTP